MDGIVARALIHFFKNKELKRAAQNKEQDPLPPNQNGNKQTPYPTLGARLPSTSLMSTVAEQNKRLSGFEVDMWDLCAGHKGGLLEEDSFNSCRSVLG